MASRLVQGKTLAGDELLPRGPASGTSAADAAVTPRWSVTFAAADPVTVDFRDDAVHITVRLAGFRSDDRDYAGMEISLQYRLQLQGHRLVMLRDGELRVYPLGFVSGQQRLSGPQFVTRKVLTTRLEGTLPAEMGLDELLGPSERESGQVTAFSTREGWLSLDLAVAER